MEIRNLSILYATVGRKKKEKKNPTLLLRIFASSDAGGFARKEINEYNNRSFLRRFAAGSVRNLVSRRLPVKRYRIALLFTHNGRIKNTNIDFFQHPVYGFCIVPVVILRVSLLSISCFFFSLPFSVKHVYTSARLHIVTTRTYLFCR